MYRLQVSSFLALPAVRNLIHGTCVGMRSKLRSKSKNIRAVHGAFVVFVPEISEAINGIRAAV